MGLEAGRLGGPQDGQSRTCWVAGEGQEQGEIWGRQGVAVGGVEAGGSGRAWRLWPWQGPLPRRLLEDSPALLLWEAQYPVETKEPRTPFNCPLQVVRVDLQSLDVGEMGKREKGREEGRLGGRE